MRLCQKISSDGGEPADFLSHWASLRRIAGETCDAELVATNVFPTREHRDWGYVEGWERYVIGFGW